MRELANLNLQLWVAKTEGFASAWRRWDRRMLNVLAPFSQWPEVWSTWILVAKLFGQNISKSGTHRGKALRSHNLNLPMLPCTLCILLWTQVLQTPDQLKRRTCKRCLRLSLTKCSPGTLPRNWCLVQLDTSFDTSKYMAISVFQSNVGCHCTSERRLLPALVSTWSPHGLIRAMRIS